MKKILLALFLSSSFALAQGTRIQPGGVPTPVPVFDITTLNSAVSNISFQIFQTYFATNQMIGSNQIIDLTSNVLIINTNISIINNFISNYFVSDGSLSAGFIFTPALQFTGSNDYWLDWGLTNAGGFHLIYGALVATNNVYFLGPTNLCQWRPLSFDIIASGGNRTISLPDSTQYIKTNGLTHIGNHYDLILTNGNLFGITYQSNIISYATWTTVGQ